MSTYDFDKAARYVVYRKMFGHNAIMWSSHRSFSAAQRTCVELTRGKRARPDTEQVFIQDKSLGSLMTCTGNFVCAGAWGRQTELPA